MLKTGRKRILLYAGIFVLLMCIAGVLVVYHFYQKVYKPNVGVQVPSAEWLYIPTGSDFNDLKDILFSSGVIHDTASFLWVARQKKFTGLVKPGRYRLRNGMNNNALVNMLRSGNQVPVRLTFNNIRTREQLAQEVASRLEVNTDELLLLLNDQSLLIEYGLNPDNAMVLFIPNTYEFYWNTDARGFIERMAKEYRRFWNEERLEKARQAGLTVAEAGILASIVQEETNKKDEMARIAGVYLNRLRRGMPLQADPTVKFALGDFTLRRVLLKHLRIDSPYNTYLYTGLPPGPICLPEPSTILSVLDFEKHEYLFFCAREDMSGYHAFARTLSEHNVNARKYQRALNQRRIMQ